MDRDTVITRIDALAECLLLSDASDAEAFARAKKDLSEIAVWAKSDGQSDVGKILESACERIDSAHLGNGTSAASIYDLTVACLSSLQMVVRDGCSVEQAQFPRALYDAVVQEKAGDEVSTKANESTSIDRGILAEFLDHASTVFADLEPVIVAAESHPAPGAVAQIRREIHTIKAEAGFVGLGEMSGLFHAVEDAIDRAGGGTIPEGILDALDWARRHIAAIEGKGSAPGSPDELVARLREFTPVAAVVVPEEPAVIAPSTRIESDPDLMREFISEAREHLDNADVHLLTVEMNSRDSEALNAVFRAFHTIKGVSGFLGLEDIKSVAHEAENLLDKARKGEIELRGTYVDTVFDTIDMLKRMIVSVEGAVATGGLLESEPGLRQLVDHIRAVLAGKVDANMETRHASPGARKRIGEILHSQGVTNPAAVGSALAAQLQIDTMPLGEILVREIVISRSQLNHALEIQKQEGSTRKLGDILVANGMARIEDINRALAKQSTPASDPVGAMLVRAKEVAPKDVAMALRGQKQHAPIEVKEAVKVDADRLDKLIDLVGELVIAESMISQSEELASVASQHLTRQISQLDKITRELQEIGMSLRMVPVRPTFQKMSRLVRDLAKKSGKQVEFITEGEDTELDKTVVDKIGDPLVHMIRNAVDHGIEASAEERIAKGKSATGSVTLRAFHKGGNIHIEIQDDGRGLNRDSILAKARERNLIREGDQLTDREIFDLIFEPGFSTAREITDVSGRGVGMDVVRRNVESLRGQVEIQSELDKGTVFSIRLPLTLAIIDGMVIRVGDERYIIPTLSVVRSIKPDAEQIATVTDRGEMLKLQGKLIPIYRLHTLFDVSSAKTDPLDAIVLILDDEGAHVGLMVDELLGQQQIVIKSLGETMKAVRGIAGGAIMGDGTVGLIIDVGGIVRLAEVTAPARAKRAMTAA
ncbi:MAG: Hpt domain-containing protein [Candidatus Hydrogenedentes bacterium]|nr:Hpt domain-containing protein [Candidatus Hydrogenedentota bacterium]